MDIEKSVAYLDAHAQKNCLGHRAEYVRKAVEVGGVHLKCHTSAKDYAPASRRSVSRPCRVRRTRPARWPSSSLFPHIRTAP